MDLSCMKNNLQIVPTKYDKSMDLYTLILKLKTKINNMTMV